MRRSLARCGPAAVIAVLLVALAAGCSDNSNTTVNRPNGSDLQPPMSPTALDWASQDFGTMEITWAPCADADLAGYNLYRYDPSPDRLQSYVKLNASLIHDTQFEVLDAQPNTSEYYRASAVDESGNESALSEALGTYLVVPPNSVPPSHEPPPADTRNTP